MKRIDHGVHGADRVARPQREGLDAQGRVASEFGYNSIPASERKQRINLGLALLQVLAIPGEPLSLDDIAAWCGCSASAIQQIEERALKKLAYRLRFMRTTDPRLAEMVEDMFYAREPALKKEAA